MSGKDESERDEDNKTALEKLKDSKQGVVKCRICKEDHWTTMCPYKETLGPLQESLAKGTTEGDEDKTGELLSNKLKTRLNSFTEDFNF